MVPPFNPRRMPRLFDIRAEAAAPWARIVRDPRMANRATTRRGPAAGWSANNLPETRGNKILLSPIA